MVDHHSRRCLGERLRHLIAGTITNLEFDDTMIDEWEGSADRGVFEVSYQAWRLYDDFVVHPIQISPHGRREIARWIISTQVSSTNGLVQP